MAKMTADQAIERLIVIVKETNIPLNLIYNYHQSKSTFNLERNKDPTKKEHRIELEKIKKTLSRHVKKPEDRKSISKSNNPVLLLGVVKRSGLTKRKKHERFITEFDIFSELTLKLDAIKHMAGSHAFLELEKELERTPLEERIRLLGLSEKQIEIAKKLFKKVDDLHEERSKFAIVMIDNPADKSLEKKERELIAGLNEIRNKLNKEMNTLAIQVRKTMLKRAVELRIGKAGGIIKLRKAIATKEKGTSAQWKLGSREKDILTKYLDVLEGKKPSKSPRKTQKPWSLKDRGKIPKPKKKPGIRRK